MSNDKTPSSDKNEQKPVEKTSPVAKAQPPKADNLFDDEDTFENSTNKKPALFSDDDIFGDNDEVICLCFDWTVYLFCFGKVFSFRFRYRLKSLTFISFI